MLSSELTVDLCSNGQPLESKEPARCLNKTNRRDQRTAISVALRCKDRQRLREIPMRDASNQAQLYEAALSSLYEAPLEPSSWRVFMHSFAQLVDAQTGQYHSWDVARNRIDFAVMLGDTYEQHQAYYNDHLAAQDPRRQLTESAEPGQWVFDHEHFDARFVERSEVYRWLIAHDIRYGAAARLADEGNMFGVLALFRSPGHQPFGTGERCWFERVTPHVHRAARLHLKYESLRAQAALGWEASSSLDYVVAIVDSDARLQFANRAAEAFFAMARTPLKVRQGQLRATLPSAQTRLTKALAAACSTPRGQGDVLAMENDRGAPHYRLVVLPLRRESAYALRANRPLALITMGATVDGSGVDIELLRQLFGLTTAEARVVEALAAGTTIARLAEEAGVSINTVRTQLQAAFSKTGTHRQAELVQLVAALPRVRR